MEFAGLKNIMRQNGIAGAGGAGFPSYMKLNPKADTIVLNCAECEPLLKLHRQLMEKFSYEIMSALSEIAKCLDVKNIIISVKSSYTRSIEAVEHNLSIFKNMKLVKLKNAYPAGDEVITIYEATGRVVPPGELPISVGVIVYNVETVFNLYKALNRNVPVTHKYVTVAGEVKNPATFKAPLGMELKELVALAGGETTDEYVYINGGPMMGKLASPYDTVTKTTNAVLVLPKNHQVVLKKKTKPSIDIKRAMSTCCQCESCTALCPRNLIGHPIEPHAVMLALAHKDYKKAEALTNTFYCSQCGLCELFSCPQGLSPRNLIGAVRNELRANGYTPDKKPVLKPVNESRDLKRVPVKRLQGRLGLTKYNVSAPLSDKELTASRLKINLSQCIGAKSVPTVKKGDTVKKYQIIADVDIKAMGLPVHSPEDGKILEVTEDFIIIGKEA
ncbi:MAG: SLBB domain-containing protein [Clostridia bacterium]|nr:SLBB domain-containing protein [Clostridia bacterium]